MQCIRTTHENCVEGPLSLRLFVVTTLLYGAEARVWYCKQIRQLTRFHQRWLRSIMNIKWLDYVTDNEFLRRADPPVLRLCCCLDNFARHGGSDNTKGCVLWLTGGGEVRQRCPSKTAQRSAKSAALTGWEQLAAVKAIWSLSTHTEAVQHSLNLIDVERRERKDAVRKLQLHKSCQTSASHEVLHSASNLQ